jgi:DNA-binding response OmpR family regulator
VRLVLVVDTHPDLWDLIREAFEETSDVSVLCTESGRDAAHLIRDLPLALVIASVNVPDISGYEVAKIAAEFDVPVLMMSGDLLAQDTLGQAGYLHLRKPFRLHELLGLAEVAMSSPSSNIAQTLAGDARLAAVEAATRLAAEVGAF